MTRFQLESLPAEWLTAATVRELTGASEARLNWLIRAGRLPRPFRPRKDRHRFWRRRDVERYLRWREENRRRW